MDAENRNFLYKAAKWIAIPAAALAGAMILSDSEGPLYVGFERPEARQEKGFDVGSLHVQYGKFLEPVADAQLSHESHGMRSFSGEYQGLPRITMRVAPPGYHDETIRKYGRGWMPLGSEEPSKKTGNASGDGE